MAVEHPDMIAAFCRWRVNVLKKKCWRIRMIIGRSEKVMA
jgi:hypothetical protein